MKFFETNKIINGENDIDKIIELFYKEETSRIKNNITIYYSKMNLDNTNNTNIYQYILKLKRIIAKTYETSIYFFNIILEDE